MPRAAKANGSQRSGALAGLQTTALIALVGGASVTAAAKEASCDRSTVLGWVHHDPAFRAALEEARHAVWTSQVDRVRAVAGKALDVLEAVLDDASAPASERLRAAREAAEMAEKERVHLCCSRRLTRLGHVPREEAVHRNASG